MFLLYQAWGEGTTCREWKGGDGIKKFEKHWSIAFYILHYGSIRSVPPRNPSTHMGVRRNFSRGESRHFAYPFQVVNDAVQMDVHKTLYPLNTTKKMPQVTPTVPKMRFVDNNASFSLMLFFTPYKTAWLTAISSYCLAALPAKLPEIFAFNSLMWQNAYCLKCLQLLKQRRI